MARHLKKLLCLVLVVFLLVGCTPTSTSTPERSEMEKLEDRLAQYAQLGSSPDDNYRTWYEIFVYSFCDSNGDGIGDLQGVISKMDYLQELGITGIWLMPIHPSYSYHKYDVNDYYAIDSAYGTMADFDAFMAECDKRGIAVILDLVVNHCGAGNPWFTEASEYLRGLQPGQEPNAEDCKYLDYFTFSTEKDKGYHAVYGTKYYYEGQFSSSMPDLNWENEAMRADVKAVMEFWLNKGVAGFRVDAAKEFYTGAVNKNVEVMRWLQQTANSIKEDAYMVAEVWESDYNTITSYYESGFTSIFNYPFGNYDGKLCKVLNGRGNAAMVTTWATALQTANKAYAGKNPNYIDAPFLSNHDVGRIYGFVSGDPLRIKMAGAMNLFMSGSTFIYYGEELGMPGSGNDPSKRAPMYWNADRNNGTTNLPPQCSLPEMGYPMGSLEEQQKDAGSVYNYYREAIAIRKALPVISHGVTTVEQNLNVGCVSAVRKTWNDQQCIILMNIDDDEAGVAVDLSAYTDWKVVATLSANGEAVAQEGTNLNMPAYGIAVLVPNN
ncbi:MAG: alpha-amylase [Oscillospiraceae bacterium]|nr:alpha-amylase [Oscillospiraceae bacterium]